MSVEFKASYDHQSYELVAEVSGVDDLEIIWSRPAKTMRPNLIGVSYAVREGEWQIGRIRVGGPWVLKGGRLSDKQHGENRYRDLGSEAPGWAQEFAERNKPAPEMVIR